MGACEGTCSYNMNRVTLLAVSVACGILSLWSIISMTCRKNPHRKVAKRDVAQLFIHLSSVLWAVSFWEWFAIDWSEHEDVSLCTLITMLVHGGQSIQKFLTLVIWRIRFTSLIGPVYPYWVRWPTLLMTMFIPILFVIDAVNVAKDNLISCDDISPNKLHAYVVITEILLIVPALIFLLLFLLPLCHYGFHHHSAFLRLILWQMMITVLDIGIHLAFVITLCNLKSDIDGLYTLLSARNVGVIVSNILILGVFVDWRERLVYGCFNSSPDVKIKRMKKTRPQYSRISSIGSLLDVKFAKSSDNVEIRNRWQTSLFIDDLMERISTFSLPRDFSGENHATFAQLKAPLLDD